jgi:hypothetical protein
MIDFARFARVLSVLAILSLSGTALAAVKLDGSWPETDKLITLDASALPRSEAVRRIADAAGWNVVWASPSTEPIDVHVKKQPATKVLELVLSDGDYVARRQGDLIQIERDKAAGTPSAVPPNPVDILKNLPAPPPLPGAPPIPSASPPGDDDDDDEEPPTPKASPSHGHHGKHHPDRTVLAGTLRVEKDETVKDVSVLGGSAAIYGTVTGDMTILGGNAHLYPGARVKGDIGMMGGALRLDDDSVVDGDVSVIGGALDRAPGAKIGGQVASGTGHGHDDEDHDTSKSKAVKAARTFGGPMARTAMLFVFGAVLLALLTRRMGYLETEAAERPMRSFALGVVGSVAMVVVAVLLCVTLIGIPVAVVGVLAAVFGAYAGVCAVLTAVGSAMLRRWTGNAYLHLAAGCALFLLLGFIPYVGVWVTVAVILTGIGVVVATRAAGYIPPRGGSFTSRPPEQTASPA